MVPRDEDDDDDWAPSLEDLVSDGEGQSDGGRESEPFDTLVDSAAALQGELGIYDASVADPEFTAKYCESNWHAKTWRLNPRATFSGPTPGPTALLGSALLSPVEFFLKFWDDRIQRKLVVESNDYADFVDPKTLKRKGGDLPTAPITLGEFRQFIGITALMGIRHQPTIRDYWRRGPEALLCVEIVQTMSRWRFLYILKCLHMVPKGSYITDKHDPAYDPIGKCRWLLEALVSNFKALWNPGPYVSVDESMVAYNGKYCAFKQYMPLKPISHGIKLWCLADSSTKYVMNLEVYVGAENEARQTLATHPAGMGAAVVTRLTQGMEGQYYTIAMDNFFSSTRLFEDLLRRGLYAIGTTRQHRLGFPCSLNIMTREPRGSLHIRVHRDRHIAAIHWMDTKGVHFLSTAADPMVTGGVSVLRCKNGEKEAVPTSPIQLCYSEHMRGVDVGDQLRGTYCSQISTKKWWHRVFFFCLDTAFVNAYICTSRLASDTICRQNSTRPSSLKLPWR